ncbi:MAG TPA: hypothetical protein VF928_02310 [Usitatibacteraceae bacterium]
MKKKVNVPRSGISLSVLLQGLILAAGAQVAFAAPAAQPAETGLLKLPNVKIQNATPQQIQAANQKSTSTKAAVRAFKDKETGRLRDQTPEEMVEDGIASAAAAPSEPLAIIDGPKGGVAALLDENFMTNAVVTKDAAGNLHMECVTGKDAAKTLVNGKAVKEHRHDR